MPAGSPEKVDVLLIGAGIFSATVASLLIRADPRLTIQVVERLQEVGQEASHPWHNAGTGHAGLCELNYTPQATDGRIDTGKAITIYEQFLQTQLFWSALQQEGALGEASSFITNTPHMGFVRGQDDMRFLKARHQALVQHHFFREMAYSEDLGEIREWVPLLAQERGPEPVAATYAASGTDVDFGSITRQLLSDFTARGGSLITGEEVQDITETSDSSWEVISGARRIQARRIFVGAGGWSLKLLRQAGIAEVRGYGLLPVSGTFLVSWYPPVTGTHQVKVYGKAPVGAPPMSMPHLDARRIDGEDAVLFGPCAGAIPTFLKNGSRWDFPASLRPDNLWPLTAMGAQNLNLLRLLIGDLTKGHRQRIAALREFFPAAQPQHWQLITAGQRAQIVKADPRRGGKLTFGTELIRSAAGTITGVLGASPGASTALPIALAALERLLPRTASSSRLRDYLPARELDLTRDEAATVWARQEVNSLLEV